MSTGQGNNPFDNQQAAAQQASALGALHGAATQPIPQGKLAEMVHQLERGNQRLNELILIQRDHCTRITGNNPVSEPDAPDAVQQSGTLQDFERALLEQNELNSKLNALTDAWGDL